MILKGCQVTPECPGIAETTFISTVGAFDFLEEQWFYQKHCLKIMEKKENSTTY